MGRRVFARAYTFTCTRCRAVETFALAISDTVMASWDRPRISIERHHVFTAVLYCLLTIVATLP